MIIFLNYVFSRDSEDDCGPSNFNREVLQNLDTATRTFPDELIALCKTNCNVLNQIITYLLQIWNLLYPCNRLTKLRAPGKAKQQFISFFQRWLVLNDYFLEYMVKDTLWRITNKASLFVKKNL